MNITLQYCSEILSANVVFGITESRMPWTTDHCASHVTPQCCTSCWHLPGLVHRTINQRRWIFFPKLLKAYPNDTNSCTTNTSQVHLFLGFQIQNDQLVPGDVHDGIVVQQLQVGPLFAVIAKGVSEEKVLRKRRDTI